MSTTVPSYPGLARQACVEGSVAIVVEIDRDGYPTSTDVLFGHPSSEPTHKLLLGNGNSRRRVTRRLVGDKRSGSHFEFLDEGRQIKT